jgi:hypothetical protein
MGGQLALWVGGRWKNRNVVFFKKRAFLDAQRIVFLGKSRLRLNKFSFFKRLRQKFD